MDRTEARAAAYRLLSSLWLDGATPDLLSTLRELPDLGGALPDPYDPDEAAAEHHRLLGFEVPPYAGVFVDPEGCIGGEAAGVVLELHARAGLPAPRGGEEADHLGHHLALLARVADRPALAAEALDRALLPWLPWLAEVVERLGSPFHRALAGLTLELALDHRRDGEMARIEPPVTPAGHGDDPLADARSGLRDLATFLATPARSGLYLARADVRALAAGERLPTGFGGRADALETLLRSGAEFGGLAVVLEGLGERVEAGRERCAALEASGVPGVAAIAALRRGRLDRAAAVVERLATARAEAEAGS